jgi:sensor c-di-GMP phosphodiesterase-like protein
MIYLLILFALIIAVLLLFIARLIQHRQDYDQLLDEALKAQEVVKYYEQLIKMNKQ